MPPEHRHSPPTARPEAPTRIVEILAFPGVQVLDVAGPLQVFTSANQAAGASITAPCAPVMVGAVGTLTSSAGLGLVASPLPGMDAPLDTLMVAGGEGVQAAAADPGLAAWLRPRAATARRVASVCTGAFLLGEVGLLDGKRAVTHRSRCAGLARRFPGDLGRSRPDLHMGRHDLDLGRDHGGHRSRFRVPKAVSATCTPGSHPTWMGICPWPNWRGSRA